MPISGNGWELLVSRHRVQRSGAQARTYGTYQTFLDGNDIAGLSGWVCECIGPGDNRQADNGKRIETGGYPLHTHFGDLYQSVGYSTDLQTPGSSPLPGLRLEGTGQRYDILIHPARPPTLYLSSVGCLNLTGPLGDSDTMDFWDSRARVIALIDSLRLFAPAAFTATENTRIPDAWVVVEGEPSG